MNLLLNNNNLLKDINNIILYNDNNIDIKKIIIDILDINNNNIIFNNLLLHNNIDNITDYIDNEFIDIFNNNINKILKKYIDPKDHFMLIFEKINKLEILLNIYNYNYCITNKITKNISFIKMTLFLIYINKVIKNEKILNKWLIKILKNDSNILKYWNFFNEEINTIINNINNINNIIPITDFDNIVKFKNLFCDKILNNFNIDDVNNTTVLKKKIILFDEFLQLHKIKLIDYLDILDIKFKLLLIPNLNILFKKIIINDEIIKILNILFKLDNNISNNKNNMINEYKIKYKEELSRIILDYLDILKNYYIKNNNFNNSKIFLNFIKQCNIFVKILNIIDVSELIINKLNEILNISGFIEYILYGFEILINDNNNIINIINIIIYLKNKNILIYKYLYHLKSRIYNNIIKCSLTNDIITKECNYNKYLIDKLNIDKNLNILNDIINFNNELKDNFNKNDNLKTIKIKYNDLLTNTIINKDYNNKCFYYITNNLNIKYTTENIINYIPKELQYYLNVGITYFNNIIETKKLYYNYDYSSIKLKYNNHFILCNIIHSAILFSYEYFTNLNGKCYKNDIIDYLKVNNKQKFEYYYNQLISYKILSINNNELLYINNINDDIIININNIDEKIIKKEEDNNILLNRNIIIECYIVKILKKYYIIYKNFIKYDIIYNDLQEQIKHLFILDDKELFNKILNKLNDNDYIEKNNDINSYKYVI